MALSRRPVYQSLGLYLTTIFALMGPVGRVLSNFGEPGVWGPSVQDPIQLLRLAMTFSPANGQLIFTALLQAS